VPLHAFIDVVFYPEDLELTIETLGYPDTYFANWFMHVCYRVVPATASYTEEEAAPARGAGDLDGVQPYPEDGSGRGRPPWYYTAFRGGRRQQGQEDQQRDYGMSHTRLYQNGRYYYDVDAGRYGYGRESNPMRKRPEDEEEFAGSGYGRPGVAGGGRRGGYGNAAAGYPRYGNDDEFKNPDGFQEEGRNGRYVP